MKSFVILDKGATAAVSRVKPQPEDGLHDHNKYPMSIDSDMKGFWGVVADTGEMKQFNAPYTIGQRVAVKEACWLLCRTDTGFYGDSDPEEVVIRGYVAYGEKPTEIIGSKSNYWSYRSPVTMPLSAVRTWAVVESVACVRVKQLTKVQMWDCVEWTRDKIYDKEIFLNYKDGFTYFEHPADSFESLVIKKIGKSAWDNNEYVFLTSFKIESK